ncbi:unnamed protein product [Ceratitis capitata]|uniref:(Mediterranean fruit fly) hypothetical protein n=1 Tax=Ceratitis capitata TaxID=7213 RepID=A0A811UW30_CERCA|nr:unnamed protein product [Ceratitis capitata]
MCYAKTTCIESHSVNRQLTPRQTPPTAAAWSSCQLHTRIHTYMHVPPSTVQLATLTRSLRSLQECYDIKIHLYKYNNKPSTDQRGQCNQIQFSIEYQTLFDFISAQRSDQLQLQAQQGSAQTYIHTYISINNYTYIGILYM